MIYQIIVSEQADADLRGIYEYIAFELLAPDYAAGQLDRLEKDIMNLDQFPEKFRQYDKEPWHSRGMRIMPVDNYCVYYVTNHDEYTVTVIRVLYDGRNSDAQLLDHTAM